MQKTINQTENGKIFRCASCNKIHIEYKNLNILLNNTELQELKRLFSKPIICQPKMISHFKYTIHNN